MQFYNNYHLPYNIVIALLKKHETQKYHLYAANIKFITYTILFFSSSFNLFRFYPFDSNFYKLIINIYLIFLLFLPLFKLFY